MPAKSIPIRALLVVSAIALVGAACGGTSASSDGVASLDDTTETTVVAADADNEVDSEQALLDFAACMRDHGVDMDDPTVDADGNVAFGAIRGQVAEGDIALDREQFQAANEECSEFLEGATLGFRRGDDAEFQDTLFEFAQCMRDNGIEMDDPDFSGFGPGGDNDDDEPGARGGPFGIIDADDPDFQAAQEACGDILGGFGPPGGGGGRPSGDDS